MARPKTTRGKQELLEKKQWLDTIRKRLKLTGRTYTDLTDACGIHYTTIASYKQDNKFPRPATKQLIEDMLLKFESRPVDKKIRLMERKMHKLATEIAERKQVLAARQKSNQVEG